MISARDRDLVVVLASFLLLVSGRLWNRVWKPPDPILIHFQPGFLRGRTVVRLDDDQHRNIIRLLRERGHDDPHG
jgi:hypothetical protein